MADRPQIDFVRLSRTISHALRHDPGQYGLRLDEYGYCGIDELLAALRQRRAWAGVERADLEHLVATLRKRRYEIVDDRIRALYGHSIAGIVPAPAAEPPRTLLHGTSPAAAERILAHGLEPRGRGMVHLSLDRETALTVGGRHSADPVVVTVLAAEAHAAGVRFHPAGELIWLTRGVPPQFLRGD